MPRSACYTHFYLETTQSVLEWVRLNRIVSSAKRPKKSQLCLLRGLAARQDAARQDTFTSLHCGSYNLLQKIIDVVGRLWLFVFLLPCCRGPLAARTASHAGLQWERLPVWLELDPWRRGACEPRAPHAADQTSRCWKSSVSRLASCGGGDEGGDPAVGNGSALQSWQEMRDMFCSAKSCSNFLQSNRELSKGRLRCKSQPQGFHRWGTAGQGSAHRDGAGRIWASPSPCWLDPDLSFSWLCVRGIYHLPAGFLLRHKESSGTAPRRGLIILFCLPKQGLSVSGISRTPCTHMSCSGRGASAQFSLSDKS